MQRGADASCITLPLQACEMFILELTLRSWSHSEENKRRTLQRNDIAAAITRTDVFDFLVRLASWSTWPLIWALGRNHMSAAWWTRCCIQRPCGRGQCREPLPRLLLSAGCDMHPQSPPGNHSLVPAAGGHRAKGRAGGRRPAAGVSSCPAASTDHSSASAGHW